MPRVLGLVLVAALAIAPPAAAQTVSATTGAINGKVTDNSGAVLPGVTVTVSSPALMGVRTNVTSSDGLYRFPAVPPGDYKVTFELSGFSNVTREAIRVGLGFTATVNAELGVANLQETVTVTGESPVIDTAATNVTTNFDAKYLANLPSARDLWAILAESPAVSLSRIDVGGSAAGTQTGYTVYGTGGQNRPMVEGIVATEGTGAAGFYYDYGSVDEVSVGTAAHNAEMGWPGVQTQFISKSGGNMYHGSLYGDYENENWQGYNVDAAQISRGAQGGGGLRPQDVNRLSNYHDVNGDVGGFILKDRLWWYLSLRDQDVSARYTNFPVKPHRTRLTNYSWKATYNLSKNNKLIAYSQYGRKHQPTRLDAFLIGATTAFQTTEESTWEQLYWGWVSKGEWNSVINDATFLEIRAGQFGYNWPNHPNGSSPRFEDTGNNNVFGGNRDWQRDRRRNQVLGSISYFKDGLAGNHNFKFGGEVFDETTVDNWKDGYPGNVVHRLNNGAPTDVYLIEPGIGRVGLWTYSGFANDTWRLNSRLTLNVGLRFDKYVGYLQEQEHPVSRFNPTAVKFAAVDNVINWTLFSPRIGATFDLGGNGKTVAKFNYGQYWWNPGADFMFNVNPNAQGGWNKRYTWNDPNHNGVYDPGEEGRLVATNGGLATESLDPNLKDTYTKEIAGWFERELMTNFGVRTGVIWRGQRQRHQRINASQPFSAFNVPVSIPDPGPDGRVGTGDDGRAISGFNLSAAALALSPHNVTMNIPDSDSDFYTWEITATKRFSRRWTMLATFAKTWIREEENGYFGNTVRQYALTSTPNDLINTFDGQHHFTTWQAKLHGTWQAPFDVKLTPILRHQSGQPWGRTFQFAFNYGTQRVLAEPLGTRRQDNITLLDLRAEKVIRFGGGRMSLGPFVDIFNMFNANPEQNINWGSGGTFLRPTNIVPPRLLRIGAKVEW